MAKKVLIPICNDDIAPRFDMAAEVWIGLFNDHWARVEDRTVILPQSSAEGLCSIILNEHIDVVVCCGIEDAYFQYLVWKKVAVYDSVIGSVAGVVSALQKNELCSGSILMERDTSVCEIS